MTTIRRVFSLHICGKPSRFSFHFYIFLLLGIINTKYYPLSLCDDKMSIVLTCIHIYSKMFVIIFMISIIWIKFCTNTAHSNNMKIKTYPFQRWKPQLTSTMKNDGNVFHFHQEWYNIFVMPILFHLSCCLCCDKCEW